MKFAEAYFVSYDENIKAHKCEEKEFVQFSKYISKAEKDIPDRYTERGGPIFCILQREKRKMSWTIGSRPPENEEPAGLVFGTLLPKYITKEA